MGIVGVLVGVLGVSNPKFFNDLQPTTKKWSIVYKKITV